MDYGWLIADEQLTIFSKAIEQIVGRIKRSESQSVQGPQYSEEDLVIWKSNPIRLRGHQSVSIAPTGTMRLLFKCEKIVTKLMADKNQS